VFVPGAGEEERVRALGGRLSLLSEPDGGTRLDVVIPLEALESTETAGQGQT
jgi:signal transduction histidine kinase